MSDPGERPSGRAELLTTMELPPVASGARDHASIHYLLVFDQASSRMYQLPADGEATIGRAPDCDVVLRDGAVSRRHARIVVTGGEARLVDLGSRNGVVVNGERVVGSRGLRTGDTLVVSSVTLIYNAGARPRPAPAAVDLAALYRRGAEEVERALQFQRPLVVVAVALSQPGFDRDAVTAAVIGATRIIDVVAWASADQLVVLLLETPGEDASHRAAALLARVTPHAPAARVAYATCPEDGCDFGTLLATARSAADTGGPATVTAASSTPRTLEIGPHRVLIADPAMMRLVELVERLAVSDLTVLITGETGSGKEVVATALHEWSPRRDGKLVTLNCAALQETLVESELFGHEKGAFSDAVAAKPGLLEIATGGTVLLDEVGELQPTTQAKLLRALETRRITRLGGVEERAIDVRLVAATNRDLPAEVRAGRFRQDLYFRLSAAAVWVPPLRDRQRELPLLAQLFLRAACAGAGRPPLAISPAAMAVLARHPWPGNVRELRNVMEYVAVTCPEATLEPRHLDRLRAAPGSAAPPVAPAPPAPPPPAPRSLPEELKAIERERMTAALEACDGNQTRAAQQLGVPLRTFVAKMIQHGIPRRRTPRGG